MKKKQRYYLKYIIAVCVALLLFSAVYLFLYAKPPKENTAPKTSVILMKPALSTITESITMSGFVEAKDLIAVVPLVSGTITSYPYKPGDYVWKGQTLAKIDDAPYLQTKLQAEAAYLGYQNTFSRIESLYNSGAASRQEYDTVKAQRDAAKAQFDLAEVQLGYATVTSPVNGTILQAPQAKGNIGTSTQPLYIITDLEQQVIRLSVPEKYYSLFRKGRTTLEAIVTRPGTEGYSESARCIGTLETLSPYIQADSKTFQAVFSLKTEDNSYISTDFRPGMYVSVQVNFRKHENVHVLPHNVRKTDGSCYMYDESSGTAVFLDFTPEASDQNSFIVPEEYGKFYFISEGKNSVFDGQKVNVVETKVYVP